MTTFKDLTPQQRDNAKKKSASCHGTQQLNGQHEKLMELAKEALRINPKLTKAEFIRTLNSREIFYAEKTIRTLLKNLPFAVAEKRAPKSRGIRYMENMEKGYQRATLGKTFHQVLPIYLSRP